MSAKDRHAVISLGDIAGGSSSNEVDMSTFQNAWLFFKNASGSTAHVLIEAAPEEYGETPTWFRYGRPVEVLNNRQTAFPIPCGVLTDYVIPARIRVTSADEAITDVFIEGVRDIA